MRSMITTCGQTVIPVEIRKRFALGPADGLEWIVEGKEIRVVPLPRDPVAAFRGQGKGQSTERLLDDRDWDRRRE